MAFGAKISELASVCNGEFRGQDGIVNHFLTDSRTLFNKEGVLFCAIKGTSFDGHRFIGKLRERGVKQFIVERGFCDFTDNEGYLIVDSPIDALQQIASNYRSTFHVTVTAVVGSNGKSIVKEWIAQLSSSGKKIYHSPKSYNSQLGVPLSVLRAEGDEEEFIFECGISRPQEMERLQQIVRPDVVIFTTLTDAHSENFLSDDQKLDEKLKMSRNASKIIFPADQPLIAAAIARTPIAEKWSWGFSADATLRILSKEISEDKSTIELLFGGKKYAFTTPFTDKISFENAMSVLCYKAAIGSPSDFEEALQKIASLEGVEMRLEVREGLNGGIVLNDSYNCDLASLSIALDTIKRYDREQVVILSDIRQSILPERELYRRVAQLIEEQDIHTVVGIGETICRNKDLFDRFSGRFFQSTQLFIDNADTAFYADKAVLLKGSRSFEFEQIASILEKQVHTTILEVNLSGLLSNFIYFRSKLNPKTKCVAMVKADAYGCGGVEVSRTLEAQGVDYFAVAYTDEGVQLRKAGISAPIVVLNSDPHGYKKMINNGLEPEIYSFTSLIEFTKEVKHALVGPHPIHLKLDTGMYRLGFEEEELGVLIDLLRENRWVRIASIFSHFTSSDNPDHDDFTAQQIATFDRMSSRLIHELKLKDTLRHIANSAASERFPEAEFDMVRLGIALYGGSDDSVAALKNVVTLKSVIAQIHSVKKGETVGYNRNQTLLRDSRIATVPIGYADGIRRELGCGNWQMAIGEALCPTVGNICMDACMIDVTDIKCAEGDEVIVFGATSNNLGALAEQLHTITYEVMTSISPRVKRIYVKE